jgi:hypothetical protein
MSEAGSEGKVGPVLRRVPVSDVVGAATAWAARSRGAVTWRPIGGLEDATGRDEVAACVAGEWVSVARPRGGARSRATLTSPETAAFAHLVSEMGAAAGRPVTAPQARAEARARGMTLPSGVAVLRCISAQNKAK